ncbi:hypothetical protein [Miltoncostaea marina]|uniref:hypothetical protein n=1 Tax=Miltoncostaea marina TaxID=2843215 RepID=UPI001C3C8CC6|nr:hypothetical protein [Miltoncostaea marina]
MSAPSAAAGGDARTFHDVARTGVDRLVALSRAGAWPEAVDVARSLKATFLEARPVLGPIPPEVFDGALAACLARDAEELDDFLDLAREIFP